MKQKSKQKRLLNPHCHVSNNAGEASERTYDRNYLVMTLWRSSHSFQESLGTPQTIPCTFPQTYHILRLVTLEILLRWMTNWEIVLRRLLCDEDFAPSLSYILHTLKENEQRQKNLVHTGTMLKRLTPHCGKVHIWRTPFRYESTESTFYWKENNVLPQHH